MRVRDVKGQTELCLAMTGFSLLTIMVCVHFLYNIKENCTRAELYYTALQLFG